jgi:hypothetical protein
MPKLVYRLCNSAVTWDQKTKITSQNCIQYINNLTWSAAKWDKTKSSKVPLPMYHNVMWIRSNATDDSGTCTKRRSGVGMLYVKNVDTVNHWTRLQRHREAGSSDRSHLKTLIKLLIKMTTERKVIAFRVKSLRWRGTDWVCVDISNQELVYEQLTDK